MFFLREAHIFDRFDRGGIFFPSLPEFVQICPNIVRILPEFDTLAKFGVYTPPPPVSYAYEVMYAYRLP